LKQDKSARLIRNLRSLIFLLS